MFGRGALLHTGSGSRKNPAALSTLSFGAFPRGCCLIYPYPSPNSPLLLDLPSAPCSAVELCQLQGCSVLGTELGPVPVSALSRRAGMGRELGDVGLSPFSTSLSLELMGLCFCPALGLGIVKPGWAEGFPWVDPEMQEVPEGQLCTAPVSSLAFGALVVGSALCSLQALLSPALCPAPSTPGQPCAITARATTAPRRTRMAWTSVWSKGAASRHW